MADNLVHKMKRGDTLPKFKCDLINGDGSPVPINDGIFKFIMKDGDGSVIVNRAGTVTLVSGVLLFTFNWLPEETATAGIFAAEVQAYYPSSGSTITFPNGDDEDSDPQFIEVRISADLAD